MIFPIAGLTGGLGNQLFQIAKALSVNEERISIDVDTSGSYQIKKSDFLDFEIPDPIQINEIRSSRLSHFLFNRCLGISVRKGTFAQLAGPFYRFIFKLAFQKLNHSKVSVPKNTGLGFYPQKKVGNTYLIGYFQTWRWLQNQAVFDVLNALKPARQNKELLNQIDQIMSARAIAVHIRLGDYVTEYKFGTLNSEYYLNALQEIDINWENRNLWIFSDDICQARKVLGDILSRAKSVTYIGEIGDSPVNAWYLMRHASDFVIGNSTFSWWAAALRLDSTGFVCAPDPWFVGLETPRDLLPTDWVKIKSSFAQLDTY